MNKLWFTYSDGALLIWLLLAHIMTDFVLQNKKMVEDKQALGWKSKYLYLHGLIASLLIWIASCFILNIWIAILAGIVHLLIDGFKIKLDTRKTIAGFIIDQLSHIIIIILVWLILIQKWLIVKKVFIQLASDYKIMLMMLGYVIIIWPTSYLIKFFISTLLLRNRSADETSDINDDAEHAGRFIGIFERIIIVTLVLLNQYDAIGFLITGKSIIRMNSKKQTEYVLMGTMLSYASAIITGCLVNWLLNFKG